MISRAEANSIHLGGRHPRGRAVSGQSGQRTSAGALSASAAAKPGAPGDGEEDVGGRALPVQERRVLLSAGLLCSAAA
jgi:hypothetical protein